MTSRISCLALFAASAAAPAFAQTPEWTYLQGGTTHGIFMYDNSEGIAACDGGRILRTETGGAPSVGGASGWKQAFTPLDYRGDLRGVFMLDGDVCYAVGDGGAILKSTDAGNNWTWINKTNPIMDHGIPVPKPAALYKIVMFDEDSGWVVGDDVTIEYTGDGWLNFGPPPGGTHAFDENPSLGGHNPRDIYDIEWLTSDIGIASSEYHRILRTTNGGLNWTSQSVSSCVSDANLELWGVDYEPVPDPSTDEYTLWCLGGLGYNEGMMFRSQDSGATWDRETAYEYEPTWVLEGYNCSDTPAHPTFYGLAHFSGNDVVGVGYGSTRIRFQTGVPGSTVTDACNNCATPASGPWWKLEDQVGTNPIYNTPPPLLAVHAVDDDEGWLCGRFGVIRHTTNSGATWVDQVTESYLRLAGGGDFVDQDTGVVFAQGNIIERTTDGGNTFTTVYPTTAADLMQFGRDIDLDSSGKGVAVGSAATVLTTTDTGLSWSKVATLSLPESPSLHACTVAPSGGPMYIAGDGGYVAKSKDSFPFWTNRSITGPRVPNVRAIEFATDTRGYAVGHNFSFPDSRAFRTINGGSNWTPIPFAAGSAKQNLNAVATWGDGTGAWCVGLSGGIYELVDTQGTLELVRRIPTGVSPMLVDLTAVQVFEDASGNLDVIVGGVDGTVLFCHKDAATSSYTWSAPKSQTTEPITALAFQSKDRGFAIGMQFLIAEYE